MTLAIAAVLLSATLVAADPPTAAAPTPPPAPEPAPFVPGVSDRQVSEIIVNASPADVWAVFSTPEGFKALGVAQCELDLRPGGLIRSHYDPKGVIGDERTIVNRILAYEPERVFAFRIDTPPKGFPFTNAWKDVWSVVTLSGAGTPSQPRTLVRLCGVGYTAAEESQKMRAFFQAGNDWVLKKLAAHFDKAAPAPTGPAHASDPLAPIVLDQLVDAPRQDVWTALSTPAGWKSFFGVTANIGAAPGAPFEIAFNDSAPAGERGSEGCTVLSLVPGRMLSHSWNAPPAQPFMRTQRTWVVVTLDDAGPARTRVHVEHHGFQDVATAHPDHAADARQTRAYFANAWPRVYSALADHFKKPDDKPAEKRAER